MRPLLKFLRPRKERPRFRRLKRRKNSSKLWPLKRPKSKRPMKRPMLKVWPTSQKTTSFKSGRHATGDFPLVGCP